MVSVSTSALLAVLEQGVDYSLIQRAWLLLCTCRADVAHEELANMTIGSVDRQLLQFRQSLFGSRFDAIAHCPMCQGMVEFRFERQDLPENVASENDSSTRQLRCDGVDLLYRLPSIGDVLVAAEDVRDARATFLERCVLGAKTEDGQPLQPSIIPPHTIQRLGEAMEAWDPMSNLRIDLKCPSCTHSWLSDFHVADYLWSELDSWARGLLKEVHQLASVYGWSEAEILALSAQRRRMYIEMTLHD